MNPRTIPLNLPNVLSLYRLFSFPFILLFVYLGYEQLFVWLFAFNQVTDILDGYIARRFKLQTPEGAILDSYADMGSYVIAFYGIVQFKPVLFQSPYLWWLVAFLACYLLQILLCKIKFNKMVIGLHLYSNKVTGYLQGGFLVVLFAHQLVVPFFYAMIAVGIVAELECIVITLWIREPIKNAKGLCWLVKNNKLN